MVVVQMLELKKAVLLERVSYGSLGSWDTRGIHVANYASYSRMLRLRQVVLMTFALNVDRRVYRSDLYESATTYTRDISYFTYQRPR